MFDLSKESSLEADIAFRVIPADRFTPIGVLEYLKAKVLLESAYAETGKGKYSIVVIKEAFTVYKKEGGYFLKNPDNKNYKLTGVKNGFLSIVKGFRDRAPMSDNHYDKPIPLGGVGFLGYEFFNEIEDIKFKNQADDRDIYECGFIFGRSFMIFDHYHDEALLCAVQYKGEIAPVDLDAELDSIIKSLSGIEGASEPASVKVPAKIINDKGQKEDFIKTVEFIKCFLSL